MESVVADLRGQLAKRSSFESAAAALASLFRDRYVGASVAEKKAMYDAACRAASLLQSRHTGKGFWLAGYKLFDAAKSAVSDPRERENMINWIAKAQKLVFEEEENNSRQQAQAGPSTGFLFEGQLTVGNEPPPPAWLVAQTAVSRQLAGADDRRVVDVEALENLLLRLSDNDAIDDLLDASFRVVESESRAPPASKDEVAKLPVIRVTDEVLKRLGEGTECAVCREVLVVEDEMQEMPCKHYFHPPCLKPWLEEHNSCPICRFEMRTDDHEYESRKEREAEAEAERKGAANALPGLDFMYV